jgi:hypothetical protein
LRLLARQPPKFRDQQRTHANHLILDQLVKLTGIRSGANNCACECGRFLSYLPKQIFFPNKQRQCDTQYKEKYNAVTIVPQ